MTGARRMAAALLGVLALAACSPDPTPLKTTTEAARDINQTDDGTANPVVVRLYSLQNKDTFTTAEFTPLYTTDRKVLAADIVSRDEFEIRPGETKVVEVKDAKNAAFVGVLAAFRDIETAKWRDVAEVRPRTGNTYTVNLTLGSVSIQKQRGFWDFVSFR